MDCKDAAQKREQIGIEEVRERFGIASRSHRIGNMDLHVAEVERPDDMVREVYPDAVTVHGDAPVWMITWPAALALAEHLVLKEQVSGARMLELGCGTAAPGIAAERAGARVLGTDYDQVALTMARYNAALNGCTAIDFRLLDWYQPDLSEGFELIAGSEIVYFEKSFVPLLSVLQRYATPSARIILYDQGRPQMKVFLEMCKGAGFAHEEIPHTVHLPERSYTVRLVLLTRRP